ncbi:outer membrane protein OmpK [Escherichia coli]|nr:outer membrane protein OmpK [Escherichia coli]
MDWTSRTTEKSSTKSHKDDFGYLEFEGGANFSWGEMYGFFDWENFYNGRHNKPGSEQRYPLKYQPYFWVTPDLISTCMRMALRFCESREFPRRYVLYGIGYNFTGSGWWFKPFFAKRYTDQTYYTGDNGYVAGWVAGYNFMLGSEKFTLTNWTSTSLTVTLPISG